MLPFSITSSTQRLQSHVTTVFWRVSYPLRSRERRVLSFPWFYSFFSAHVASIASIRVCRESKSAYTSVRFELMQRNARRWYHRVPHNFDFGELRLKMQNGADIRTSNLMSDSELDEFEVGTVVDACVH